MLEEELGKGAAGSVFRAKDTLLDIHVCVKLLHEALSADRAILERFKRELLIARRVAHPGVCRVFDLGEDGDTRYLVMEYVQGEDLAKVLNRDKRLEVPRAIALMRQVCQALGAAHKEGVVHRDLKPGNIILRPDGRATIVDFGIATASDLDRLTRPGIVMGSRSYLAPEVWKGAPASAASDIWAVGIILYGCVTGKLPYKGDGLVGVLEAIQNSRPIPPSVHNPAVPPALEAVIAKAMSLEPQDRYHDALAMDAALAALEGKGAAGASVFELSSLNLGGADPESAPIIDELALVAGELAVAFEQADEVPASMTHADAPAAKRSTEAPVTLDELSLYPGDRPTTDSAPQWALEAAEAIEDSGANPALEEKTLAPPDDGTELSPGTPITGEPSLVPGEAIPLPGKADTTRRVDVDTLVAEARAADARAAEERAAEERAAADFFDEAPPSGDEQATKQVNLTKLQGPDEPTRRVTFSDVEPAAPPSEKTQVTPALDGTLPSVLVDMTLSADSLAVLDESAPTQDGPGALSELTQDVNEHTLEDDLERAFLELPRRPSSSSVDVSVTEDVRFEPAAEETPSRRGRLMAAVAGAVVLLIAVAVTVAFVGGDDEGGAVASGGEGASVAASTEAVEDKPVEDKPVEDKAAHDELDDEKPDDERPTGDKPVEDPPADDGVWDFASDDAPVEAPDDAPADAPDERDEAGAADRSASAGDKARYRTRRRALDGATRDKGILWGDVPRLDAQRRKMYAAAKAKRWDAAAAAAQSAKSVAEAAKIDKRFVERKLARFNKKYDKSKDAGLKKELGKVFLSVTKALSREDYPGANSALNRGFKLLSEQR